MNTITKANTSEYLSKDILEEDFLKVFSYFNTAQRILGSSRVYARDCFVSPPTAFQKVYTIICCILFPFGSYVFSIIYVVRYKESPYVGFTLQSGVALYISVFLCNMIHVRFLNNEANVKFYIKMQVVDRAMGIGLHKAINNYLRFAYNATILSLGGLICILMLMFVNLGLLFFGLSAFMYVYGTVTLETVYCVNLAAYFILRARFINSIVSNYIEQDHYVGKVTLNNVTKRSSMRQLAARTHDFRTWNVDVHLRALFECFEQFQNLYRFQIMLSLVNYILSVIIIVEFVTLGLQSSVDLDGREPGNSHKHSSLAMAVGVTLRINTVMISLYTVLTVPDCVLSFSFLIIGAIQIALLCFRLEIFFREVKETKSLCIRIMSISLNGPVRDKVKKTLKMIEESAPSFNIYGIFKINAQMMLKLTSSVTVIVVTLLQFAFL